MQFIKKEYYMSQGAAALLPLPYLKGNKLHMQ